MWSEKLTSRLNFHISVTVCQRRDFDVYFISSTDWELLPKDGGNLVTSLTLWDIYFPEYPVDLDTERGIYGKSL